MKTSQIFRTGSSIELLESRIAPASLTFTDVDGDMVHVTVSGAATMDDLDHAVHRAASGSGFKITGIDLAGRSIFQNADLTITTDLGGGGDGLVNVGGINAKKLDLHDVTIDGNLVQIDVGDGATATPALNHLTAESFGTPAGGSDDAPASFINGGVGTLEVHGDVNKAWIRVAAGKANKADGSIGSIMITGALLGGKSKRSGSITATGEITNATVTGALIGGKGVESGSIGTLGNIGTITVGEIFGGKGKHSGGILTKGGIDDVTVNGSLVGGTGVESGSVGSLLQVQTATVHGSVVGGAGKRSGGIVSRTSLGNVTIDGSLVGGSGSVSGAIGSDGSISMVQIGGSLLGGERPFTGAILSGHDIGVIAITGAMQNNLSFQANFTSIISARGILGSLSVASLSGTPDNRVMIAADNDPAISGLASSSAINTLTTSVVEFTNILGGFAFLPGKTYRNADASIGTVSVSSNWIASTIAAGALVKDRVFHGLTNKDLRRTLVHDGGSPAIDSAINSLNIGGSVIRDDKSGQISGFIAERIFSATCVGTSLGPLTPGPHTDDNLIFNFNDLIVGRLTEGDRTSD